MSTPIAWKGSAEHWRHAEGAAPRRVDVKDGKAVLAGEAGRQRGAGPCREPGVARGGVAGGADLGTPTPGTRNAECGMRNGPSRTRSAERGARNPQDQTRNAERGTRNDAGAGQVAAVDPLTQAHAQRDAVVAPDSPPGGSERNPDNPVHPVPPPATSILRTSCQRPPGAGCDRTRARRLGLPVTRPSTALSPRYRKAWRRNRPGARGPRG